MEDIKSLIGKPTTNAQLEKPKNSSDVLSKRQMALIALIQQTQARRGLPLISAGFELQNVVLVAWEKALKVVPDNYLSRAYEHAADNWDWTNGKAFTADAVADAYKLLVVEDRQRQEADRRNAQRQNKDTYRCWHCCDLGYQPLYSYQHKRWYSSYRPCCCEATPAAQRQQFPLDETVWKRNKVGEYASWADIEKYGPPNDNFKEAIKAGEGGK